MKSPFLMACGLVSALAGCTFDSSQLRVLGPDGAAGATADAGGIGGQGGASVSPGDAGGTGGAGASEAGTDAGVAGSGGRGSGYAGVSGTGGTGLSGGQTGVSGTGDTGGVGGSSGVDAGVAIPDAFPDAPVDAGVAVPDAFPDAPVDAGEGEDISSTTPTIVSFTASPTTISAGKSSTLSWTVTSATMLSLDQGAGSALVSVLGTTSQVVTPTQTTTYTLTLNGTMSAQVTVTVVPLPTITSFSASPTAVRSGSSTTLTAVFSGGTGTVDHGIGAVISGVGTSTGPITADTTYTLTVTNALGGSTTAQVRVALLTTLTNGLAVWVAQKPVGGSGTLGGQITLSLRIDNKTAQTVDMSTVTLRYWYQDEGLGTALVLLANYVSIGYSGQGKVTGLIAVTNPSPVAGADHYLQFSFSGTLAAQGDPATNDQFNIQVIVHTADYKGTVDVTNDYSYDGGAEAVYEQKITLYESSVLIWGIEP